MAGSTRYRERYLHGECEQVWAELFALGEQVREEPYHTDARAVAQETMRRARYNIELLIQRLGTVGYQFGYAWWDADFREMLELNPPPPTYAPPRSDVQDQLAELEAHVGLLPLSLRAWYEEVGTVNLVGLFPVKDATDPEGWTSYIQFAHAHSSGGASFPSRHDLDPLMVDSLEHMLELVHAREDSPIKRMYSGGRYELELAPDEWLKYGVSGGGPYVIRVPNACADANVEYDWHETTFVDYLRTCFRWGGFPGLECKRRKPEADLAFLTESLLAI